MTVATKKPTRREYEAVTFKAPSRIEYEKSIPKEVEAPKPARRAEGIDISGPFDVWAAPPDSQIWKSPGADFTRGFGQGWLRQTQIPALMGRKLPSPTTKAEWIGEKSGQMMEAITELIGVGAILRGVGLLGGKIPKGAALGRALRTGLLFGTQQVTEEARKATAEAIYDEDFGSRGGMAVLESVALGGILSLAFSGVGRVGRAVWEKLKPSEQVQALKTLGLKRGASLHEINKAARIYARKYHPDKIRGMREQFDKVIQARDALRKAKSGDVIIAHAKQNFQKQLMAKVGVSEDVARNAIQRLDAGESIEKVDQMISQAKVLGKLPPTVPITEPSGLLAGRKAPKAPITPAKPKAVEVAAKKAIPTREELYEIYEQTQAAEEKTDREILGDNLEKYNRAQSRLGSMKDEVVERAEDVIEEIESKLTKTEINKLYGIGEKGRTAEDLRIELNARDDVADALDEGNRDKALERLERFASDYEWARLALERIEQTKAQPVAKAEPAKVEKVARKPKEFTMAAETTADFPLMSEALLPQKVGGVMKYTETTGKEGEWRGGIKEVGKFLKKFARTVPEFTADPVFVVSKDKMIVYQDGGRFKFKPEAFGIDAKKIIEGDKIRVNLESYGIKVASIARQIAAKKLPLRPPVKPKGKPGFIDVRPLLKVHKTFMGIVEPSKAVELKLGKEPYAIVIKGVHEVDVGRIEFNEAQIEGQDKSLSQLSEWFNKFSEKELKNFMLSRGSPRTKQAQIIQQEARKSLHQNLGKSELFNAFQRIADQNYKYLQSVVGDDIHRVEDYFYGIWKSPKKVDKLLDYWHTTKRFTKEKKLPTVADAMDYDLTMELRNWNPIENLKAEYIAISHLKGMNWMKDELLRTGKGKFIDETLEAPLEWDMVQDPVFKDLRLQPELAKLINNLIATNKITRIPLANTLREINNVARTIKFVGSAFHLLSVAKQSIADSGYFGFLYKPTATRGFTRGFRTNDPIFRTTAYKDYVRHGGGHRYSVESEARRTFNRAVDELNRNMGLAVKVGALPLKIPTGFVNWMFQSYIPKVKYSKFLDVVAEQEKKLGRILTSPEKIDIIKEQQNFYGMMNERLFGRSGTVTTITRFWWMSPGYAEGNYRSMLKALLQWGGKTGFKANRSRSNIINSWLITGIAATVGTLAFTGKPPRKPETLDDARDLFKIDTGKSDEKGRKIMIDLMTYDKDYWNVAFNILRLRPDVAIGKSWKRIGGMKAPTADIIVDLALMAMGKAVYDWKGDRVVEITDPFLLKAMKLTKHEVEKLVPISVSVFQQSKKRDIDTTVAAIETLLGFRPTKTEQDIREQKIISKMYSLAGQREEMSYYIGQSTDPKRTVAKYNKTVNGILNSPYIPKSMKDEWGPRLLVDYDKVVTWKRFPAGKMTDLELRRAYDAHTLSVPYKRRGEPFRQIGEPKKGSERRVGELKAEAQKRGIELKRGPRKPPRR